MSFWRALNRLGRSAAPLHEWQARGATASGWIHALLRPSEHLSTSHPCTGPGGCGCLHDVIQHGDDDFVAVCACGSRCDTFPVCQDALLCYEVDDVRLQSKLAELLALVPAPSPIPAMPGLTLVGTYVPLAGISAPAFFALLPLGDGLEGCINWLLSRSRAPFLLIAPSGRDLSAESRAQLAASSSEFLSLEDVTAIDEFGNVGLVRSSEELLAPLRATLIPPRMVTAPRPSFPTPPGSTWQDVHIRFLDEEKVRVQVRGEVKTYKYDKMGFADGRSRRPTKAWDLMLLLAARHGELTWRDPGADPKHKKHRGALNRILSAFFGLSGQAIGLTQDRKGWMALIQLIPCGEYQVSRKLPMARSGKRRSSEEL